MTLRQFKKIVQSNGHRLTKVGPDFVIDDFHKEIATGSSIKECYEKYFAYVAKRNLTKYYE